MISKDLKKQALNLTASDKLKLVDLLVDSLDEPDPNIEKLWIKESEARYAAYKKGKVKAKDVDKVIDSIKRKRSK